MRVGASVVAVAGAALAAGCGSSSSEGTTAPPTAVTDPAARFVVRIDADLTRGRFRRVWRSLHPAQQRILSATALADCWSKQAQFERAVQFEARDVRDTAWTIPGGPAQPQPARAVRVRIFAVGSRKALDVFTQHVFRVGNRYRWIVRAKILRDFRHGACGST